MLLVFVPTSMADVDNDTTKKLILGPINRQYHNLVPKNMYDVGRSGLVRADQSTNPPRPTTNDEP